MSDEENKVIEAYKLRWGDLFFSLFFEFLHRVDKNDLNFQNLYAPILKEFKIEDFNKKTKWGKFEWILHQMKVEDEECQKIRYLIWKIYQGFTGQEPNHLTIKIDNYNIDDIIKQSDKLPIVFYIKNRNEPDHWFLMHESQLFTTYGMFAYVDETKVVKGSDVEDPKNEGNISSPLKTFKMTDESILLKFKRLLTLLEADQVYQNSSEYIDLYKYFFLGITLKVDEFENVTEISQAKSSHHTISKERIKRRIDEEAIYSSDNRRNINIVALQYNDEHMSKHIFYIFNLIIKYHYTEINKFRSLKLIKEITGG